MRVSVIFFLISFSIFVLFYNTGINTLPIQSEDTVPTMFLPVTILKEGTLYADSYYHVMIERYPQPDDRNQKLGYTPFYLKKIIDYSDEYLKCEADSNPKLVACLDSIPNAIIGTHYITAFTILPGLLALPIYALPVLMGMDITWSNLIFLSHLSASLIVCLSGCVLYLILKKYFLREKSDTRKIHLILVIYLFGTVNFAMISQSLWQHGAVQLFSLAGLYFLLSNLQKKSFYSAFLTGLFLSLAVLSRPTAALFALLLMLSVLFTYKSSVREMIRQYVYIALGVLPSLIFFVWYNNYYFKSYANQGYASQLFDSWISPFPEGFLGIWLSPSKGILVYSPILIFTIIGFVQAYKSKHVENRNIYVISGMIILAHTLLMGKWKHWYGGYSFGYRLASDALPFFMLLVVPFLQSTLYPKLTKIFFTLMFVSIVVQLSGLVFFDGIWHNAYDRGFTDTSWLWSLRDSEAVFNVRRILVKFGYLERACPKCLPNATN